MRIYVDAAIMQKDKPYNGDAKYLHGFVSPFDAEVVAKLLANRHEIISDSEAADAALYNDLHGKKRREAAEKNIYYIHPTYGTVSRYGLIPSACSMDTLGLMCKDLNTGFELLSQIVGNDEKDGAMVTNPILPPRQASPSASVKNLNMLSYNRLKHHDVYNQIFQILTSAEISHNLNRYDGIKFGYRADGFRGLNELYTKTRSESFNPKTKLTAIAGALLLSQDYYEPYYEQAMKIRRLIREDVNHLLVGNSIIDAPVDSPLPQLAGLPSVTFSKNGKGVQLIANVGQETLLKEVASQ